ncbi:hypothetical protein DM860_017341 [Cuscuta australis]|uniref:Uncharacterized protein n=1 Tax=Cuscuta australis TaxID=267555 RepID=A0A328DGA4_9ASTE|nr:hypothetical protein DM860_017341 [Cuscuta australis]
MFGAVQIGIMAACVVLFVPLGMAGWHLSRNKMLFFSCALFITLSVGVHLTPYFPSIPSFLPSPGFPPPHSSSESINPRSCISSLHQVAFSNESWGWAKSGLADWCEFQKLRRQDVSDLLNGSWVVVAGDSQARLLVVSLLELLLGSNETELIRGDLFKRHGDYTIGLDKIGVNLDYRWAPYVSNLTNLVFGLKDNKKFPDLLVMGSGLWDMLHVNDASDYGVSLKLLRDSLVMSLPVYPGSVSGNGRSPRLFWVGLPKLVNSKLNTEEKREKMGDAQSQAYCDEVYRSKLLLQYGGPFFLLDIHRLSDRCGARCTEDGMHYNGIVYDAAVQIMLNELVIESNQKLI